MASGFGGRYQGSVVDDADPIGEHRLRVIVPEVWGTVRHDWGSQYRSVHFQGSLRWLGITAMELHAPRVFRGGCWLGSKGAGYKNKACPPPEAA